MDGADPRRPCPGRVVRIRRCRAEHSRLGAALRSRVVERGIQGGCLVSRCTGKSKGGPAAVTERGAADVSGVDIPLWNGLPSPICFAARISGKKERGGERKRGQRCLQQREEETGTGGLGRPVDQTELGWVAQQHA
jgi:hypothetical protein